MLMESTKLNCNTADTKVRLRSLKTVITQRRALMAFVPPFDSLHLIYN